MAVKRVIHHAPALLAKVAKRNGMTPACLMGPGEGRIMQMVHVYLAERQAASAASLPR